MQSQLAHGSRSHRLQCNCIVRSDQCGRSTDKQSGGANPMHAHNFSLYFPYISIVCAIDIRRKLLALRSPERYRRARCCDQEASLELECMRSTHFGSRLSSGQKQEHSLSLSNYVRCLRSSFSIMTSTSICVSKVTVAAVVHIAARSG